MFLFESLVFEYFVESAKIPGLRKEIGQKSAKKFKILENYNNNPDTYYV